MKGFVNAVVHTNFTTDVSDVRKFLKGDVDLHVECPLEFLHQFIERQTRNVDKTFRPAQYFRIGYRFDEKMTVREISNIVRFQYNVFCVGSSRFVICTRPWSNAVEKRWWRSSATTLNFVPNTRISDAKVSTTNGHLSSCSTSNTASPESFTLRRFFLNTDGYSIFAPELS